MTDDREHFYVYAITFDQDTFGIFAMREAAEESLREQIAAGGPAWDGCAIERWRVEGKPELGESDRSHGEGGDRST